MRMQNLERIAPYCTRRLALASAATAAIWTILLVYIAEIRLIDSFDGRWNGYNHNATVSILNRLSNGDGLAVYLSKHFPLDMVYPLLYGPALFIGFVYLLKQRRIANRWIWSIALLPLAGAIFDLIENILVRHLILQYLDNPELIRASLVRAASGFTQAKFFSLSISVLFLGILAVLPIANQLIAAFGNQKGSIALALASIILLIWTPAIRELYRTDVIGSHSHILIEIFFIGTLASALFCYGHRAALRSQQSHCTSMAVRDGLLRYLPGICASAVLVSVAIGMYWASIELQMAIFDSGAESTKLVTSATQHKVQIVQSELALGVRSLERSASVYLLLGFLVFSLLGSPILRRLGLLERYCFGRLIELHYAGLIAVALLVFLCVIVLPVAFPRLIGTLSVVCLFLVSVTLLIDAANVIRKRTPLPLLAPAVALALAYSMLDLNDNHLVEPVASTKSPQDRVDASTAFRTWLASRKDREAYREQPYPVFIVSAAGGGLYAARHAAIFLSRIQDSCPHFAQHVFAISSVSGGSLGAGVFSSIVSREVHQTDKPGCRFSDSPGPIELRASEFLDRDYLSPSVAAGLFPDLLQRFIPIPFYGFDRARQFDSAVEKTWNDIYGRQSNPFEKSFLEHWSPAGAAPALVINATHVASGHRVVMAPFVPNDTIEGMAKISWLQENLIGADRSPSLDLRLSTSIGISARFPWVMPAARVQTRQGDIRLVDGGYFENSGADTVAELVRALDRIDDYDSLTPENRLKGKFRVFVIFIRGYDLPSQFGASRDVGYFDELMSPVRGLLSTREARADIATLRAMETLCPNLECKQPASGADRADWVVAGLNLRDFSLPLSWRLSRYSNQAIGIHAGNVADCKVVSGMRYSRWFDVPHWLQTAERRTRIYEAIATGGCAIQRVCLNLRPVNLSEGAGQVCE